MDLELSPDLIQQVVQDARIQSAVRAGVRRQVTLVWCLIGVLLLILSVASGFLSYALLSLQGQEQQVADFRAEATEQLRIIEARLKALEQTSPKKENTFAAAGEGSSPDSYEDNEFVLKQQMQKLNDAMRNMGSVPGGNAEHTTIKHSVERGSAGQARGYSEIVLSGQEPTQTERGEKGESSLAVTTVPAANATSATGKPKIGDFFIKATSTSALLAAFDQARNNPAAWGQGLAGYERRFASRLVKTAIYKYLQFSVARLTGETNRNCRSGLPGRWQRIRYGAFRTFISDTQEGGRSLAYSQLAGSYGSSLIATRWYPQGKNSIGSGLKAGTVSLSIKAATNMTREFLPEILAPKFLEPICPKD